MLGTISKSLVVASLLSLTVACSQQEAPKSQKVSTKITHLRDQVANAPARNEANAALTCEEIWTGFVAANPLGLSKEYQATTVTEYTGGEGLPAPETVIEKQKDTVTLSSDEKVAITYGYSNSASPVATPDEVQEITKVDFLASCNTPVAEAPVEAPVNAPAAAPAPTVEILEEGTESLTVAAGTFATDFVKGKITQTGEGAYTALASEWYVTGTDFLVKSIWDSTSTFDTIVVRTTQTVELISYVNPAAPTAPVATAAN